MKRLLLGLTLLPFIFVSINAQQLKTNQKTAVPLDARYELLQSSIAAQFTFKLDKFTGIVFQLVEKKDGSLTWEKMRRVPMTDDLLVVPGKPNYQLFTSGLAARFTFLMNINSGITWQLVTDPTTEEVYWDRLTK